MLSTLPLGIRVGLGIVALVVGGGWLYLMLRPVRDFLEHQGPAIPDRAPAHVCRHCGTVLVSGTMPPIFSACGPENRECTRPRR